MRQDIGFGPSLRLDKPTAQLALTTSAAESPELTPGIYAVWCDSDVYIKTGQTADDVTVLTGYLLYAGTQISVEVNFGEKLGGILASGTGDLNYRRVSA